MYNLHFAYPHIFYIFIPIWILINLYRWKFYKPAQYVFPLTSQIRQISQSSNAKINPGRALFALKSATLFFMIFLIARPQWVDSRSKINVDGVKIAITLDVSGSMQLFDDIKDRRSRIDVAKKEAIKFIKKRTDDPLGIVIFGADAISQCPLTLDKKILINIVENITLGIIDESRTSLGTGIAVAVNKLRPSRMIPPAEKDVSTKNPENKVIILLTDGQPTPDSEQVPVDEAVKMAKKFGIKIYTVGIGNKNGAFVRSAFGFIQRVEDSVDENLLKHIASETNGRFFRANNPKDMQTIYETIDKLEKTEYQTNLFSRYYEAFASFVWIVLCLIFLELFLSLFFWRGIL